MVPRISRPGPPVLGMLACLFVLWTSCAGRADNVQDFQKALDEADRAFQQNRPADALKHLNQALELVRDFQPGDKDYIKEAYLWINKKEPTPALNAIDKALGKNSKAAEAYFVRGYVYSKLLPDNASNRASALQGLKKALELKKDASAPVSKQWPDDAMYELWDLLRDGFRDFDLAASEFQSLVQADPDNPKLLYYLGLAHTLRKSYDQATESFLKVLDLRPDDWQTHLDLTIPAEKFAGVKGTIRYYEDLLQKHPAELAMQMGLAKLYLKDGQKDKAVPLLRKARMHPSLLDLKNIDNLHILSIRIELAKGFAQADEHQEAAAQFARVLAGLPPNWSVEGKIDLTIEYGKALVRANEIEDGIKVLNEALVSHRRRFPNQQEPLDILFELGLAHWNLGKTDKTKRTGEAEIFFRKYLQELKAGAAGNQRFAKDVKIAESLGDLYLEAGDYRKAANAFKQALETIEYAVDKEKCPTSRVQYRYVQALHGQGAWADCIVAAKDLIRDKEYGLLTRQLLAQAFVENQQPLKGIEQLSELRGTKEWNDDSLLMMGKALLASTPPRPTEALKYIEEAFQKQPGDEKRALEYAQVLRVLDRANEARDLYQKVLQISPRSAKAMIGLGDLEMQLAKGTSGTERLGHYVQAVSHYKDARDLGQSTDVLDKLGQAEREQARSEADVQAKTDRLRLILYTGGLILAVLIPVGFMVYVYRRQWALHCFRQVCDLESDLIRLIRDRVQSRWNGHWEKFTEEPFRGRVDFKSLRNRAEKEGAKDILGVANFGHLVGIVDAGWEVLGFHELCARELADPKEVIVANLSYVSSCRVCLAHFGKLEELTAKHVGRDRLTQSTLKTHLSKHLHRQVKTSLKIIRTRFNITPGPAELPVLAPVKPGSDHVWRPR